MKMADECIGKIQSKKSQQFFRDKNLRTPNDPGELNESEWGEELPGETGLTPLQAFKARIVQLEAIPRDLADSFLEQFLVARGYDITAASLLLDQYFLTRQEWPLLSRDMDPTSPTNRSELNAVYVLPLPDSTEDGFKVLLTGLRDPHPRGYKVVQHLKAVSLTIDLMLWENELGFGDLLIVFDCRGLEVPHLQNVFQHREIRNHVLGTIPCTLRGFYLLYPPPFFRETARLHDGIWVKTFNNKQAMRDKVPPDILPLEFGGNLGHLEEMLGQWDQRVEERKSYFVEFEDEMRKIFQRRTRAARVLEERKSRSPGWVYRMKLVEDDYANKLRYYAQIKDKQQVTHKGFGKLRDGRLHLRKWEDPLRESKRLARLEEGESDWSKAPNAEPRGAPELQSEKELCWPLVAILAENK